MTADSSLAVGTLQPAPGSTGIPTDTRIVVSFDRPVVPLGSTATAAALPDPITIDPPIQGSGEWVNTSIFAFTPSEALAGSTTYTVSVAPDVQAADGASLRDSFAWQFTTVAPRVVSVAPLQGVEGVALDAPITLTFNQPIDRQSLADNLAVLLNGEAIEGDLSWNDDDTVVTFTPAQRLELETDYTVVLPTQIVGVSGTPLEAGLSTTFSTAPYPRVAETYPANGAVDIDLNTYASPTITFNVPMNFETLRDRIVIEPEPELFYPEVYNYTPERVNLRFETQPKTQYTITILAGVEDIYGNAIPNDTVFTFTTAPLADTIVPLINGTIMTVSAYDDDTAIAMQVGGNAETYFTLYPLTPEQLIEAGAASFNDYRAQFDLEASTGMSLPTGMSDVDYLRFWTQQFSSGGERQAIVPVPIASDDGGQLAPGLYYLATNSSAPADPYNSFYNLNFAVVVATDILTVKRGQDETLIWATDLLTSQPTPGLTVTLTQLAEVIAEGVTDEDGMFRVATPDFQTIDYNQPTSGRDQLIVTAQTEGRFGAWYSGYVEPNRTARGYVYTDRPLYRPGETVYYRGVLRDRDDVTYTVPDRGTVQVTLRVPYEETIYQTVDLPVTAFGTFSGEFVIPAEAAFGEMVIRADFGDGEAYQFGYIYPVYQAGSSSQVSFTVGNFRVPEYAVSVVAQQDSIIQGEAVRGLVTTNYYAGGAVSNADAAYNIVANPTSFQYTGVGNYRFLSEFDPSNQYFYDEPLVNTETIVPERSGILAATNADGQLVIESENTQHPLGLPAPIEITLRASINDESNQAISGETRVIAHPAAVYVGLDTDSYFATVGDAFDLNLITVTPDSEPIAGQSVELIYEFMEWTRREIPGQYGQYQYEETDVEVGRFQVVTDETGRVAVPVTAQSEGNYRIRAQVRDQEGRLNEASLRIYAPGENAVLWGSNSRDYVQIIPDAERYQPGDTANLLIPLPFEGGAISGTALISVERANVMRYTLVPFDNASLVFALPLEDADAPTVYISVVAFRAASNGDGTPDYAVGTIQLNVEPTPYRLNIEVTPSQALAAPRDEVSFNLRVTDAKGDPAQAEIGTALTDEAVLSLLPTNSTTLEEMFYGLQDHGVATTQSMRGLIDLLLQAQLFRGGGGGGGGGLDQAPYVREDFVYTPLWESVVTDENGEASVSVTLPDNLTAWRFDARAVTANTRVGQQTSAIVSTLPLIVRPITPRFLVVGDQVEFAAIVNNNTDQEQTVEVTLDTADLLVDAAAQTVTIPAGGRARAAWTATVDDADLIMRGVDVTFIAVGEDGAQDAAKPALRTGPNETIAVYAYRAPDTSATSGVLTEAATLTEAIIIPDETTGSLTVQLDFSLTAAIVGSVEALAELPGYSIESTTSCLLANAEARRALATRRAGDAAQFALFDTAIADALVRLRDTQRADGAWSWAGEAGSANVMVTAYALIGLAEARDLYFSLGVESDVDLLSIIDRGANYVRGAVLETVGNNNRTESELNRQAFLLYALARANSRNLRELTALASLADDLAAQRDRLSISGRAFLLMTFDTAAPEHEAIPALISLLTDDAILNATGVHWEDADDPFNWTSDTRATALVLAAIARVDADNALLPNIVRWLLVARQGDRWPSLQESAWSLIALTDYAVAVGEATPEYSYNVRIGSPASDIIMLEGNATPANAAERQTASLPLDTLTAGDSAQLTFTRGEGTGSLYYSATLRLQLPADEVEAASRGISVTREIFAPRNREATISSANAGDLVTVRLTVILSQDVYYFTLEDPLAAGLEAVNPSLLSSAGFGDSPSLERADLDPNDPFYYFGAAFDSIEFRDDRTVLESDFLARGTYVFSYQARAVTPGVYQVIPAQGYAAFMPEVFGRTAGGTFTVTAAAE